MRAIPACRMSVSNVPCSTSELSAVLGCAGSSVVDHARNRDVDDAAGPSRVSATGAAACVTPSSA